MTGLRIGHGYDVHRFADNRILILGGVQIPHEFGLLGHSDADVLLHAICDSLLGAAALGDIGTHFPDNDNRYLNANSLDLLKSVKAIIEKNNFFVCNIDATIIAQAPRLKPYIEEMRYNIAKALVLDIGCVSVKATTEEGLGFTGREEGISAHCICLLSKK